MMHRKMINQEKMMMMRTRRRRRRRSWSLHHFLPHLKKAPFSFFFLFGEGVKGGGVNGNLYQRMLLKSPILLYSICKQQKTKTILSYQLSQPLKSNSIVVSQPGMPQMCYCTIPCIKGGRKGNYTVLAQPKLYLYTG